MNMLLSKFCWFWFRCIVLYFWRSRKFAVSNMSSAFGSDLIAVEEIVNPNLTLMIVGETLNTNDWSKACSASGVPSTESLSYSVGCWKKLPYLPALRDDSGDTVAYLCEAFTCSAPYIFVWGIISDTTWMKNSNKALICGMVCVRVPGNIKLRR